MKHYFNYRLLFMQIIICTTKMVWSRENGTQFHFHAIDTAEGLIMEEGSRIRLYNTEWKIISYLNLTQFQEEFQDIKAVKENITRLCQGLPDLKQQFLREYNNTPERSFTQSLDCGMVLTPVNNIMKEIEEFNYEWFIY